MYILQTVEEGEVTLAGRHDTTLSNGNDQRNKNITFELIHISRNSCYRKRCFRSRLWDTARGSLRLRAGTRDVV